MQQYTADDLNEFDRLTKLESSKYQMDRINARLQWGNWVGGHKWTKATLDAMKDELVKQGRW